MNNSTKEFKLNPILSKQQRIYKSISKNMQNKASSNDKCKENDNDRSLFLKDNALRSNRLPTQFSAQYLSLVSKLKVNIFKAQMAKSVSKDRGISNNQSESRIEKRNLQEDKTIKIKAAQSSREEASNLNINLNKSNPNDKYRYCSVLNDSNTRHLQQQVVFKRKAAHSISNCVRHSGNQLNTSTASNQINLSQQTAKNNITSLASIKESSAHNDNSLSRGYKLVMDRRCKTKPNELFTHIQPEDQRETSQPSSAYNWNYPQREQLIYHVQIILGLYEALEEIKKHSTNVEQINAALSKLLKSYVLGSKKIINVNNNTNSNTNNNANTNNNIHGSNRSKSNRDIDASQMIMDDISHLDDIAVKQQIKKDIRWMVLLERVGVIAMLDCITNGVIQKHFISIGQVLASLLGIYLHFLTIISKNTSYSYSLQQIYRKAAKYTLHIRRDIHASCAFIEKKIAAIMKESVGSNNIGNISNLNASNTNNSTTMLFYQMKVLVTQLNHNSVTINRGFYELLKLYAVYLNNNQIIIQRNFAMIRSFATCPSPYLMKQTQKPYTLVLDLDGTLIYSYSQPAPSYKFAVKMRPHLMEFLSQMSKWYELIVWTSSMPQYAEEIIAMLPPIQHSLFRYHTTRYKGKHVKDLARLGRRIQSTIIVDNEEGNFMLQPANGIHIRQWSSSSQDVEDEELTILGGFLRDIANKQIADVRNEVVNYKAYRKQFI